MERLILHTHATHLQAEQYKWNRMNSINEEQTSHGGRRGGGGRIENTGLQRGSYAPTSATRLGPDILLGWFPGCWNPQCWPFLSSWGVGLRSQTLFLKPCPPQPPKDLVTHPSLTPRDGISTTQGSKSNSTGYVKILCFRKHFERCLFRKQKLSRPTWLEKKISYLKFFCFFKNSMLVPHCLKNKCLPSKND